MTSLEIVSLTLGGAGTALGIINTCTNIWTARRRVRVKLTIASKIGYTAPDGGVIFARGLTGDAPDWVDLSRPSHVAIEVVNYSHFPVTVDELGIVSGKNRFVWTAPRLSAGKSSPPRLEYRESVTACVPINSIPVELLADGLPYCSTQGGPITRGHNRPWREFAEIRLAKRGE